MCVDVCYFSVFVTLWEYTIAQDYLIKHDFKKFEFSFKVVTEIV